MLKRIIRNETINNIWESPTVMTWMSYATKAITLIGILPLILKKFNPEDVVLWYLFATIISLQSLADFGFRQTFSRIIAYAMGGAEDLNIGKKTQNEAEIQSRESNWNLLTEIVNVMMYLYRRLTICVFFLMISVGTLAMIKPISAVKFQNDAWVGWAIVVIASSLSFYSKVYMNFLEGLNKIALVRRVETFTSLGAIACSIVVLIWFPSLLNLVIVNQFWLIVSAARDWYLCKNIENNIFNKVNINQTINKPLLKQIWEPAWRSGIGGLMSAGVTNLTSVVYAQVGNSEAVASYLLAMRLITQIREISMAPFYSKLPVMALLRARNDISNLKLVIKRGMKVSHFVFVFGFILTSICIAPFLKYIDSEIKFVDMNLWALLGLAFFAHRFGAMHMQVYLTTNHVISHIADGISGLLFIGTAMILSKFIDVYAIPVGMLVGYLFFYDWYSAKYSYRSLGNETFFKFEKDTSFLSMIILLLYVIIVYVINMFNI